MSIDEKRKALGLEITDWKAMKNKRALSKWQLEQKERVESYLLSKKRDEFNRNLEKKIKAMQERKARKERKITLNGRSFEELSEEDQKKYTEELYKEVYGKNIIREMI